jgi:two-component system response regulator YesN
MRFTQCAWLLYAVEEMNSKEDLEKLIHEIFHSYSALLKSDTTTIYSKHIAKSLRYINEHLYDTITVNDISRYLGLNPRYFAALFKKELGERPTDYIKRKKMKEAHILISKYGHSPREVAEMMGYNSTSYFSLLYKDYFGTSPYK